MIASGAIEMKINGQMFSGGKASEKHTAWISASPITHRHPIGRGSLV